MVLLRARLRHYRSDQETRTAHLPDGRGPDSKSRTPAVERWQILLDLVDPDRGGGKFTLGVPLVVPRQTLTVVILDVIDQTGPVGDAGVDARQHDRGQVVPLDRVH